MYLLPRPPLIIWTRGLSASPVSSSNTTRVPLPPFTLIFFIDRFDTRGFSNNSSLTPPNPPPASSSSSSWSACALFSWPALWRGFDTTLNISSSLLSAPSSCENKRVWYSVSTVPRKRAHTHNARAQATRLASWPLVAGNHGSARLPCPAPSCGRYRTAHHGFYG